MLIPTRLYKYTRRVYAADILAFGNVWINTLENLRNEDIYGLEIGDKGEGTQRTFIRGKEIDLQNPNTIPPTIKRSIEEGRLTGKGKLIIKEDIKESLSNFYVYSLSTNPNLKKMFGKDSADYDCVIEIHKVEPFVRSLTEGIHQEFPQIKECFLNPITYYPREQELEAQIDTHPIWIKQPRHSWQEEFRLVWHTTGQEMKPKIFKCPDVREYITVYPF